jgi:glucosyl-dolichyl phosphate glucuronosyltransferase
MDISVILCTYNRSQSLANALASIAAQELPASISWEVLIVDNKSHDRTRTVIEQFCREYPARFRYLFEPQPGKSFALNMGIREAGGDILAFVDDDVVVDTSWLANLTAPLRDGDWAGSGGRILPDWTCAPPKWLPRHGRYRLAPLAIFDLGLQAGPLLEPPFGTNMAYRKLMFWTYGGFRTDLGPRPGSEIRNEDTEFGARLLSAGERLRYEPSAVVYHAVPQNRLRKGYFLDWWFDKARADVRQYGSTEETSWCIAGIPICLFRKLARWTVCWLLTLTPSARFSRKLKTWSVIGAIVEYSYQSHEGRAAMKTGAT